MSAKKKDNGLGDALDFIMGGQAPAGSAAAPAREGKPKTEAERLASLPKGRSEIISFRVPKGEKARLEQVFKESIGESLAEGVKRAVYAYLKTLKG